jgi:hypothetical protein
LGGSPCSAILNNNLARRTVASARWRHVSWAGTAL